MNYYPHHLGDYMRDAGHLSMLEDGAYRRLLDAYYTKEGPLPGDINAVCRLIRAKFTGEKAAAAKVLSEFFSKCSDGYHHSRCDQEIERYRAKSEKARRNAKESWSKRIANAEQTHSESIPDAMDSHSERSANPITNNQEPIKSSVAKATDKPSSLSDIGLVNETARQELFGLVQPIAKQFSLSEGRTRGIFGRAVKLSGNDHAAIVDLVRRAQHGPPMELEPWLMAACKPKEKIIYGAELTDADLEGHPQYRYRAHAKTLGSAQGD